MALGTRNWSEDLEGLREEYRLNNVYKYFGASPFKDLKTNNKRLYSKLIRQPFKRWQNWGNMGMLSSVSQKSHSRAEGFWLTPTYRDLQ